MKTKLLVLLALNFSFSLAMAQVDAQDLTPLNDGLNTEISQETTQEMSRWASSAKTMLEDLKQRAQGLPTSTQVSLFEQGIDQVVLSSGNSSAQLLMRFSLNRAMYVANLVQVEAGNERGVADFKLNLYRHAIELALHYYESDLAYLQDSGSESVRQSYAVFGIEFANILLRLNRNVVDLSAQYGVFVKAFEFLRSDLQADLDAQEYAADFVRLNNALGTSGTANTDALMRSSIRDLRRVVETLSVHNGHGLLFVPGAAVVEAEREAEAEVPAQSASTEKRPCGLSGSVDERIRNCSSQADSSSGRFVLVTRTRWGEEVYKDLRAGLLWSDQYTSEHYGRAQFACARLTEVAGITGKAWKIPSKEEFEAANTNGIRSALPRMSYYLYWAFPAAASNSGGQWMFDGNTGIFHPVSRTSGAISVRCVAAADSEIPDQTSSTEKRPCGLTGSIDQRIRDCSYQGDSSPQGFVLVTRTRELEEVHKEISSGLLWSDRLSRSMTHQEAHTACLNIPTEAVGMIGGRSWRLPTKEEYEVAERNGIRFAHSNMNHAFWSSSVHSRYSSDAWLFNGGSGNIGNDSRHFNYSVRCVSE